MEFYKIVEHEAGCLLEPECGQNGLLFDNLALSRLAQLLCDCYRKQERLPLRFRRYLTVYESNGQMEYVALWEADCLREKPPLDGFATTWLEGEEENRVWFGADGAVENRGPSGAKVKMVLELLLQALAENAEKIKIGEE